MKDTKKSLLLSGASLVLSAALLVGSTFAWFTDSVTNTGNKVQAGTLSIDAVAYDLAESGDKGFAIEGVNGGDTFYFEEQGQDLKTDKTPIISEKNWEPGVSSAKLLQVTNNGTLAAKIKVDFTVLEKDLTDALWFDFVQVGEDGTISGNFTQRPMSTLETFADKLELPLSSGKSVQFILVYGMDKEAGNEYQGKTFAADVSVLATQYTEEKDGFGSNQYDKDATLNFTPVETKEEIESALTEGKNVELMNSITSTERINTPVDAKEIVINGNGNTISVTEPVANSRVLSLIATSAEGPGCQADVNVSINGTNLINNSTSAYSRGISFSYLNGANVNVTDSTVKAGYYALNFTANNENVTIRFQNATIEGWAALNCYANNSTFVFENCTLSGQNTHSGPTNNFSILVLDGNNINGTAETAGRYGSGNTLTFNNCDFLAKTSTENDEYILSFQYGACNNTVNFNSCTFNYQPQDKRTFITTTEDATGNRVFMDGEEIPLT